MKYFTLAILAATAYAGMNQASLAKKPHPNLCVDHNSKKVTQATGNCPEGTQAMSLSDFEAANLKDYNTAECTSCHVADEAHRSDYKRLQPGVSAE